MEESIIKFSVLSNKIEKFEQNFKKCSKAKKTKGYLNGRISGLQQLWREVKEVDEKIETMRTKDSDKLDYFKDDEYGVLEEQYYGILGEIEEQLEAFKPKQQLVVNQNSNGTLNDAGRQGNDGQSNVKLPKIELPKFSGSYSKWLSFKNRFENLIHNSARLSNVEKLEYLKSCLTDTAETAIQRYQITDQNYDAAWGRLNEKYDNKRILQDTQVEAIIDRREMKSDTAKELRELIDVVQESIEELKNMDLNEEALWNAMLLVLVKRKLSFKTREEWEKELEPTEVPRYEKLIEFLEKRYRTLENMEIVGAMSESASKNKYDARSSKQRKDCLACSNGSHPLGKCEKFSNMSISNRYAFVKAKRLCMNCMALGHSVAECRNNMRCFHCKKSHHTLLHREEANRSQEPKYGSQRQQSSAYVTNSNSNRSHENSQGGRRQHRVDTESQRAQMQAPDAKQGQDVQQDKSIQQEAQVKQNLTSIAEDVTMGDRGKGEALFPTAIVRVKSKEGTIYNLRALIDQCSEEDAFIKESVATMLGIEQIVVPSFDVTGLNGTITSTVKKATKMKMFIEDEAIEIRASVIKTLVGILPKSVARWPKRAFKNLKLADPSYATPNNVDLMLGSRMYANILLDGVLKEDGYIAQNTKLGWIISGKGESLERPQRSLICLHTNSVREREPDEILRRFWEIEEAPRKVKAFTPEERQCELVFKESYRRLESGRPQVRLPFKENPSEALGESRNQAVARWLAMERKLTKNGELSRDYMDAMKEHLEMGHMARVDTPVKEHRLKQADGTDRYNCYYIPHHAVVREESKTTKTRIVFDASARTSTGKSLNDILMIGPTIQESLIVRLMKWRSKRYALRGDITKMYRQIKVYDEDVNYQRMVFRFSKEDPIEDYSLNTLTFGTASAPYMAIRTLRQIALDSELEYPIGSKIVKEDFHVDDLLTGGNTVEEVKLIWREVTEMLEKGKFPMRKWSSNSNEVLEQVPSREREFNANEIKMEDTLKTLGIGWSPIEDYFFIKAPEVDSDQKLTKRNFLSQAAKLFDPLGWLGPAIIKPKVMFQRMWKEGLNWDDKVSEELANEWIEFRSEFKYFEMMRVPRWFGNELDSIVELHGFSDASERAYGAVIYVKATNSKGESKIQIVLAKSRVAPVRKVRLPRLELCGTVLLANLIDMVGNELKVESRYCWTDSSVTLGWINSESDKYKTFVANRIAEVQELTKVEQWRHVEGKHNPADCLSRGLSPKELLTHELWWNGPPWLKWSKDKWPKNPNVVIPEDQVELKSKSVLVTTEVRVNEVIEKLLVRYSSFKKLLRVSARIRTWKNKARSECLSVEELEKEKVFWIKYVQRLAFKSEVEALESNDQIHSKSKLLSLNPFLDSLGIMRIGGRLKEANVNYDSKHQVVIPKNSTLSHMIINDAHEKTNHGGTQITMACTRTEYWIIDTRKSVRNRIHKCVRCHRFSKKTQSQLMGSLPSPRVNLTRAFLHTGVDYAGPYDVLTMRKPGRRQVTKGWVAVFVCLCTKAIHLELVSRLTSESFHAAFKKFYSRRGLPSDMYSDNSTTFIGAKNDLEGDVKIIKEQLEPELASIMLKDSVQWHFIPPHAPHWGGIWEAGVKSMKHHVRRVIGESVHTFEEISTVLAEIEAVLNSRPLCPVSNDSDDLTMLTPAHFLIGDSLLAPPKPSLLDVNPNRLGIYKQMSQRVEHFARRWKKEYLSMLQHRRKWMRQCENVEVGDLVLVKDDDCPPLKWKMGRIKEVFPDEEGLIRKAIVRTESSELMRPIEKISILPIDRALERAPGSVINE